MLITLLVLLLIFAVFWWVIQQLSLPQPVRMVVVVVFAIICLVYLLGFLPAGHLPRGLL